MTDFVDRELRALRRDQATAASLARAADDDVAAMRRVATELDRTIEPVRTLLEPIRTRHVVATWEGRAATASRRRLDRLADQLQGTLRSVDHLVGELRSSADRRQAASEQYWTDYAVYARQIRGLADLLADATLSHDG